MTRAIDPDLYKDKIEVSLDGRQIFTLFFGGAVVASLVFVLGVMVGRRLESRAHVDRAAATSAVRDPLAALDRLAEGKGELTFPAALGSGRGSTRTPAAEVDRALTALGDPGRSSEPDGKGNAVEKEKAGPKSNPPEPAKVVVTEKPKPVVHDAEPVSKPDGPKDGKGKKGRFTLQLSAFQAQVEADSFLATVKAAGYSAYVVTADVEGKGTFYRVRLGNYDNYDDAIAAKGEFERKVPKIAYLIRL